MLLPNLSNGAFAAAAVSERAMTPSSIFWSFQISHETILNTGCIQKG